MTQLFNFSKLKNIYSTAWIDKEHSLAFEVAIGRGRYVFMIFFSPEDKASSGEELYIHLRNVNSLMRMKLYGSRKNGVFNVYIRPDQAQLMIDELQLRSGGGHFTFESLLNELNDVIQQHIDFKDKINKIRDVWSVVGDQLSNALDDADKTILIGIKKLPQGYHPREKTLRKLFMFTNSRATDVSAFIASLKRFCRINGGGSAEVLHCLLFRQPTDRIVLPGTIYLRQDDEAALCVSCGLAQCPPVSSALVETI